jgi:hypothetical protein
VQQKIRCLQKGIKVLFAIVKPTAEGVCQGQPQAACLQCLEMHLPGFSLSENFWQTCPRRRLDAADFTGSLIFSFPVFCFI